MSGGQDRADKLFMQKLATNAGFYRNHDQLAHAPSRQTIRRHNRKIVKAEMKRQYDQAVALELSIHRRGGSDRAPDA